MNHNIDPVYSSESTILILGSFPSVKSREVGFFYGHPQNRFWKVITNIYNSEITLDIDDKKQFLLNNKIALWDVIESCEIEGSSDSSIKNVVINPISQLINKTKITRVFTNGKMADKLYNEYCIEETNIASNQLPSTSPANAAYSLEKLIEIWSKSIRM